MPDASHTDSNPVALRHSYVGLAHEARQAIGCDAAWAEGSCFENLPEMNDHDPCGRCHLAWRVECFESEATDWWGELERRDDELERVTTERDDAYALIRHYADTDPEVALAERMRPVVEAAKACADCDCESPRHDDDGNLFLPKGGYPCAWDCPHLEGLLDAVEAYRVATSEQERCECVPAVDEDGAPDGYEYVCNLHEKASEREASDA